MTSVEVIEKVREKLNKNSINDNIAFDRPRIILAVNEAQNKYVEWTIEKKNEDDIVFIQKLIVNDLKLTKSPKKSDDSEYFEIPSNYFHPINLKVYAKNEECKKKRINAWEAKGQNIHELLADNNNKPSFYWEETFYTIGQDKYRVFKDKTFEIEQVNLDYYRYPKKIDVEGYIDVNNKNTFTSNPELDDKAMDRIIDIAVKDLNINSENLNRIQADINRINSEN